MSFGSETSTIPAETIGLESPVIFDDQFSRLAVSQGVLFRRLEKANPPEPAGAVALAGSPSHFSFVAVIGRNLGVENYYPHDSFLLFYTDSFLFREYYYKNAVITHNDDCIDNTSVLKDPTGTNIYLLQPLESSTVIQVAIWLFVRPYRQKSKCSAPT